LDECEELDLGEFLCYYSWTLSLLSSFNFSVFYFWVFRAYSLILSSN